MGDKKLIGEEFDMTPEEFNKSLSRAEMGVFLTCKASKKPHSIFVVAQPGAGKTGLKGYLINHGQDTGELSSYIEFNPDNIGVYHEHYADIMRTYPDESFPILQRFIRPALDDYLRKKAVDLRTNIVQEGTFASKDGYLAILDFQKNGGVAPLGRLLPDGTREPRQVTGNYHIEVAALAVDRFESLLSSYEREQFFRENHMAPRIVLPKYHDDSYDKMLDTLDEVEKRGLADRLTVYRRGYTEDRPELVWVNGDKRFPTVREAMEFYRKRNRMMLLYNSDGYLSRVNSLEAAALDPDQKQRIKVLRKEFVQEVERFENDKIRLD